MAVRLTDNMQHSCSNLMAPKTLSKVLYATWLVFPVTYFSANQLKIEITLIFSLAAVVISLAASSPIFVRPSEKSAKPLHAAIIGIVSAIVICLVGGMPASLISWAGLILVACIFVLSSYEFTMSTTISGVLLLICFFVFGGGLELLNGNTGAAAAKVDTIFLTNLGLFGNELGKGLAYVISFSVFVFLLTVMGFPYYVANTWGHFISRFRMMKSADTVLKLSIVQHFTSSSTQAVAIMEDLEPNGLPNTGEDVKPGGVAIPAVIAAQSPIGFPLFGAAIFFLIEQLGLSFREIFFGLLPFSILLSSIAFVVCAGFKSLRSVIALGLCYTVISAFIYYVCVLILNNNFSVSIVSAFLVCAVIILVLTFVCRTKVSDFRIVDTGVTKLLGLPPTNEKLYFLKGPQQYIPILFLIFLVSVDVDPVDAIVLSSFAAAFSIISFLVFGKSEGNRAQFLIDAYRSYVILLMEFGRYLSRNILAIAFTGVLLGVFYSTDFPNNFLTFYTNLFEFNVLVFLVVSALICLLLGGPLPTIPTYLLTSSIFLPVLLFGFFSQGVVPSALGFCFFLLCISVFASLTPPDSLCLDLCREWIPGGTSLQERTIWIELCWFACPPLLVAAAAPFMLGLDPNTSAGIDEFLFTGATTFFGIVFIMFGLRRMRERRWKFSSLAFLLVVSGIFLYLPRNYFDPVWHSSDQYPGNRYFEVMDTNEFRPHVTLVFANGVDATSRESQQISLPAGTSGLERLQNLGVTVSPAKSGVLVVTEVRRTAGNSGYRLMPGSVLSSFNVTKSQGHYGLGALLLWLLGSGFIWFANKRDD